VGVIGALSVAALVQFVQFSVRGVACTSCQRLVLVLLRVSSARGGHFVLISDDNNQPHGHAAPTTATHGRVQVGGTTATAHGRAKVVVGATGRW
jgi:hypothetical protein